MNKSELIASIAEKAGIPATTAEAALNATLKSITHELSEGGEVSLVGFGSFSARQRAAREVRNPKTGEKMTTPAKVVPVFKAGKGLKDQVEAGSK